MSHNLTFDDFLDFLFSKPNDLLIEFSAYSTNDTHVSHTFTCRIIDAIYILPVFKFSFYFNYKLL